MAARYEPLESAKIFIGEKLLIELKSLIELLELSRAGRTGGTEETGTEKEAKA